MARAKSIYIVTKNFNTHGTQILAAFTVKWEMLDWIEKKHGGLGSHEDVLKINDGMNPNKPESLYGEVLAALSVT